MVIFYDPITSILVCRFVLSLRQFDNTLRSSATLPEISSSQLREHTASMVLPFGAQPSDNLPAFISSFAHPVHVTSDLPEVGETGATIDDRADWGETHPVASTSRLSPPGPSAQPSATVAV
ncbi:hypothetical protein GSI_04934 [Ganoderma sinense ZZ0214-1]|uniref:Uncharacterized protein n=1 Tax=Ganoderma sinense ZZ0214-1 TaxID=1077348 RepID=A0A2G8SGJ0_9APHY|nr:hypothetical protein GSI_04934 [Ganoderma sinense ZZ0214-1]